MGLSVLRDRVVVSAAQDHIAIGTRKPRTLVARNLAGATDQYVPLEQRAMPAAADPIIGTPLPLTLAERSHV